MPQAPFFDSRSLKLFLRGSGQCLAYTQKQVLLSYCSASSMLLMSARWKILLDCMSSLPLPCLWVLGDTAASQESLGWQCCMVVGDRWKMNSSYPNSTMYCQQNKPKFYQVSHGKYQLQLNDPLLDFIYLRWLFYFIPVIEVLLYKVPSVNSQSRFLTACQAHNAWLSVLS